MNEALMSRPFLHFFLSFSLVDGMLKCKWEQLQNTRPHHLHLSERFKERGITQ